MLKAILLLLIGVPPLISAVFLPSYLPQIREEQDWRAHPDPYDFLERWAFGAHHWEAMVKLDEAQRRDGFIARLVTESRYGPGTCAARNYGRPSGIRRVARCSPEAVLPRSAGTLSPAR